MTDVTSDVRELIAAAEDALAQLDAILRRLDDFIEHAKADAHRSDREVDEGGPS